MNSEPSKSETTTLSAPDVEALPVKARAVFAGNEQVRGTPEVLRSGLFSKEATIQFFVTVLEILHKTVSLVAFFLVGLALRNLFKMKG